MNHRDFSILLADDDENIRLIVEGYLRRIGYDTTSVADGAEALGKFARLEFDICVLDIHMPHFDGLELVAAIRGVNPGCRILFITGEANEAEIRRVYDERMGVAVLRKPFKLETLRNYLEMLAGSIDIERKERSAADRRAEYIASLPPGRRLVERAGGALRRLHETFVLYAVLASLLVALTLTYSVGRLSEMNARSERSLQDMYVNMMTVLERWEREDTRRDGR